MKSLVRKSPPLRAQVYEALLKMLSDGFYAPGKRLTEDRLAADLSVSRTPVREALSQLHRDGLIEMRQSGGGYRVPLPSWKEIDDTFEVRRLLEPFAVESLARQIRADQLAVIQSAVDWEASCIEDDGPNDFASANAAFRSAIFDEVSNGKLREVISQFGKHLNFIRMLTLQDRSIRRRVVEEQRTIQAALKDRDAKRARRLWEDYLAFAERALRNAMERYEA